MLYQFSLFINKYLKIVIYRYHLKTLKMCVLGKYVCVRDEYSFGSNKASTVIDNLLTD